MAATNNDEYHLPGAYHSSIEIQQQQLSTSSPSFSSSLPLAIMSSVLFPCHTESILGQPQLLQPTTLPGAWVTVDHPEKTQKADENEEIITLRRAVATLRKEAAELEKTDVLVKKSIEIVTHKRLLAEHRRRRRSKWDWCEDDSSSSSSSSSSDEDEEGETFPDCQRRTNKDTDDDDDWEWI